MRSDQPVVAAGLPRQAETLPLEDNDLVVRLARGDRDHRAARRLRADVFAEGLRRGRADSFALGPDGDAFDRYCDHLIVADRRRGDIAGACRLLSSDRAPTYGFPAEREFEIDRLRSTGARLLELGRSCIAPDFRSARVIRLLLRGVAAYARSIGARILMGSAGVRGNDVGELRAIHALLRTGYGAGPETFVAPKSGFDLPGIHAPALFDEVEVLRKLTPLLRSCLRLGARICGPSAFDRSSGTMRLVLAAPVEGPRRREPLRFPVPYRVA